MFEFAEFHKDLHNLLYRILIIQLIINIFHIITIIMFNIQFVVSLLSNWVLILKIKHTDWYLLMKSPSQITMHRHKMFVTMCYLIPSALILPSFFKTPCWSLLQPRDCNNMLWSGYTRIGDTIWRYKNRSATVCVWIPG